MPPPQLLENIALNLNVSGEELFILPKESEPKVEGNAEKQAMQIGLLLLSGAGASHGRCAIPFGCW